MEKVILTVNGMTCGHCKAAVTNAVSELKGVEKVEVSLEEKKVTVEYDGAAITVENIKTQIEDQGYDVE